MSSFKKKKQSRYTLSKADIDFYKLTGVFGIACIFVLLALKMQGTVGERIATGRNLTRNFYEFCRTPAFLVIAAVAALGAVAWFAYCRLKKVDESARIFTSTNCLSLVAYLAFFSACFGLSDVGRFHGFFIIVTIGAAALYYASKIYKADFVVYSVITAVMAMSVYLWGMRFEAYMVILKLLVVAGCVCFGLYYKKKLSSLKISKQTKSSFLVFPCYISLALGTVLLFWAYFQSMAFFRQSPGLLKVQGMIFLNHNMMLYAILTQYIVFVIVYTVRRIKD